jgi:hypothetical protein
MKLNHHANIEGQHAFLSPSYYHWLRYDDQKLEARYHSVSAAKRGTDLHKFAERAIELKIKLRGTKETIAAFVNDSIDFGLVPEVGLFYSPNCFGHADALGFRKNLLRISDLKTGVSKSSFQQLEVYAAIFCLEYGYDPREIDIELRIYQNKETHIHIPFGEVILEIMDKIIYFDDRIERLKLENGDEW